MRGLISGTFLRGHLATFAAALTGGGIAQAGQIPLPWVLGSMGAVATMMLLGAGVRQPLVARRAAQITIGTALGLTFTQTIISQIASMGHWLAVGAVFSVGLTMLFSRIIQRLAGIDAPTAIYSVAVGASAEMAMQAQQAGADGALVAAAHAVRIITVISMATAVAHWTGETGGVTAYTAVAVLPWSMGLTLLCLAPLSGYLAHLISLPNAWLLGPVLMAGAFAASGLDAKMYSVALVIAQVTLGWGLGQHMNRQFFSKSPRMLFSALIVTIGMVTICLLLAWCLSKATDITLLTGFLSLAPGGTAEMAIIAKAYGIGAPLVTAFHFLRVVTTILTIKYVAGVLVRSGWVSIQPSPVPTEDAKR